MPRFCTSGPSPRGWGNRCRASAATRSRRAIPTWVGKSFSLVYTRRTSPGPSPRGWGNPLARGGGAASARAIPTRVGKSIQRSARSLGKTGLPHVGVEIETTGLNASSASGPSPRGWGNRVTNALHESAARAIPTWVGKSHPPADSGGDETGHPHVGGEILRSNARKLSPSGPSPRGWGNQHFVPPP